MELNENIIRRQSQCQWEGVINNDLCTSYDMTNHMDNLGVVAVLFALWISGAIVTSNLISDPSYYNLATYILASGLRRSTPGFIHILPVFKKIYRFDEFAFITCDVFAFCETFFAVFEIESLTMVCIERYVLAKYKLKGWTIPDNHNYLYFCLCFSFAFCYSWPPLVVGRYAKDFDCMHCTFDMILPPAGWLRTMVLFIFFMRSVKPSILMLLMLYWAYITERKLNNNQAQRTMTKGVIAAVCIHLLCMLPIFVIRAWVILSQLIYGEIAVLGQGFILAMALFLHWSTPAFTMLGLTIYDSWLRQHMLNCFSGPSLENEYEESSDEDSY